jgi:hypothetical protein
MSYNGYTNYETWAVGMFLDGNYDGEGVYRDALEIAEEADNEYDLSIRLQAFTEEHIVSDEYDGLRGDLLGAALSEVNWQELAEGKLQEVAEAAQS